jgi:hypothetical protein
MTVRHQHMTIGIEQRHIGSGYPGRDLNWSTSAVKRNFLPSLLAATALAASATPHGAAAQGPGTPEAESLFGREPTGPSQPAPRLIDGHPDFTGFWKGIKEPNKPGGNIGKDLPGFKLPLTPAGQAALQHNITKTVDPEALCILGGIPRHDASALPFQVLHTPTRVGFLYLYNTNRIVPVDGRKHEEDPDPRYFGNAIGWWEGDTLVVDSVGFHDSAEGKFWIDENANPVSDETHTVERWTRPDRDHIHVDLRIEDPKYYAHPFTFSRTWVLGPAEQLPVEYACAENNIDAAHIGPGPGPIGPDGNRGYKVPDLPDVPPGPEFYERKKK